VVVVVGTLAAVLTTGCWVPQMARTLRTRSAEDFSWPYLFLLFFGLGGWFAYGLLKSAPPIYLANGLTLVFVLVVMVVKGRTGAVFVEEVTVFETIIEQAPLSPPDQD
jgi:MtN3 and saliva related transmembrane protein